ncbi:MAG: hypothetical protein AAGM22_20865 [Acidobacteriota bacterium]
MRAMVTLSLLLNLGVLVPVCAGLLLDSPWTRPAYGDPTPARDILLSVYLTIGFCSVALLFLRDLKLVAALLIVQILYKLLTPFIVGTLTNPVVVSNIFIAAFHTVTVVLLLTSEDGPFR